MYWKLEVTGAIKNKTQRIITHSESLPTGKASGQEDNTGKASGLDNVNDRILKDLQL